MPPLSFYVGRFDKLLEDGSSNRKAKNILKDRSGPHVSFALCPLPLLLVCSECRFFFRSWSKNKQTHKQKQTQRRWTRKSGRSLRCWELLLGSCTSLGLPIAFTWHEKEKKKKRLSLCDLGFHVHLAICNCNIKLLALRLLEIQGGSQVLIHHGFISWHSKGPRQKKKGEPRSCVLNETSICTLLSPLILIIVFTLTTEAEIFWRWKELKEGDSTHRGPLFV